MIDRESAFSNAMRSAASGHMPTADEINSLPVPTGQSAPVFRRGTRAILKEAVETFNGGEHNHARRIAESAIDTHQRLWRDADEALPDEPVEDPRVLAARVSRDYYH